MSNSLSAPSKDKRSEPVDPMMQHAKIWRHVKGLPPDELGAHVDRTDYVLPILGALASNPKVTSKMVIKAASQAVADQKIPPSQAVQFISQIPAEPEKLQPWLRQLYAANLSAAVHMKAAMMQQAAHPDPEEQPIAPQAPPGNPLRG